MVKVRAFKAIRPTKELAHRVAALPYDVMNSDEAREMVEGNPYSFLHIDKADIDLDKAINKYDKVVYEKAKQNLESMIENKVFIQDEEPCLYIYQQTMNGKSQIGLVVCCSIDDYIKDKVKKHEFTTKAKEKDRINHVDYCDANTGPIFLTYRSNEILKNIVKEWSSKEALYSFVSEDGIKHDVWIIDNKNATENIINTFDSIDSLYIADGHHRANSAVTVGLKRRKENPNYNGTEEFNYFLAVAFPHDELNILDYNRVVKDLNGFTKEQFLERVREGFHLKELQQDVKCKPQQKGIFGMYLDGTWYELRNRTTITSGLDEVNSLDVSILQNNLLAPILGIDDPRDSDRIEFIGGIRGLKELERRVNKDMAVAFSLYPTLINEIMDIADKGEVMPPKSTWFEPKLRSGLFIHKLR